MKNFLAKKYNTNDEFVYSLVNRFLTPELLEIAKPVQNIPENADDLYYKINGQYYDPMEICTAIQIIDLRNEIAAIKGITLK